MINDQITLVILPGLDGTEVFFREGMSLFPDSIHPVVVIYPGIGPNSYDDLLKIVREQTAGLTDFFVLGSSFSGPLAVRLAAEEPQRVRGIILSATFLRLPRPDLLKYKLVAIEPIVWALRTVRRIPVWLRKRDDSYRQAKAETWRRVSAKCLAMRLRTVLDVDVRDAWQRCAQPALCIAFERDDVVPRHNADEIVRLRPDTVLSIIPGDHMGMGKDPAYWTREIARFIEAVVTSASASAAPPFGH